MTNCPKCNKELSDGTKFCDGCGAQIFETIFCPNCGKQTSTEFASCQSCGASIAETPIDAEEPLAAVPTEKKKLPKKLILFGGSGVAVIAVLIIVISLLFSGVGNGKNNYALYLKDNEIFFTDLKKNSKAWQLTSDLFDTDYEGSTKELAEAGYGLSCYTYMSEDGKYIFFPDKTDDATFNLYYKEVAKPDSEAIKIDSNIQFYTVNTSATLVTYLKGDENNLYQFTIGKDSKEKLQAMFQTLKYLMMAKRLVILIPKIASI